MISVAFVKTLTLSFVPTVIPVPTEAVGKAVIADAELPIVTPVTTASPVPVVEVAPVATVTAVPATGTVVEEVSLIGTVVALVFLIGTVTSEKFTSLNVYWVVVCVSGAAEPIVNISLVTVAPCNKSVEGSYSDPVVDVKL